MHNSRKSTFRKCLSVLLALVLLLGAVPVTVFADDMIIGEDTKVLEYDNKAEEVADYSAEIEDESVLNEPVVVQDVIGAAVGTVIWSLRTDPYIQNLPLGSTTLAGTPFLNPAGAEVAAVENPLDADDIALEVTGRTADWHGLQILRQGLESAGMSVGNTYNIVVSGRAVAPPGNGQMVLRQSANPWNNLSGLVSVTPDNPNFTINWTFTPEQANLAGQDMRIQTPTGASATMSFIIDDIIITRTIVGPAAYTLVANGEAGVALTTEITLNFLRAISPDLELNQITFNPRATGAEVEGLRRVADDEYVLEIGGMARWGYVEVVIDHPDVQAGSRVVMIYHDESYFIPNEPLRPYFPWVHDPDFRELMPLEEMLNDPFQFFVTTDGQSGGYGEVIPNRVVTELDWEHRRAEIRDLVMYYYAGYLWPTTADNVTVNTQNVVRGSEANAINITVDEYRTDGTPVSATGNIATGVWLPTYEQLRANGFYETGGPIIIGTGHTLSVASRNAALERGIAVAVVPGPGDARPHTGMYTQLFPYNPNETVYNTGSMMIHAWNVSRFLDALEIMQDEWRVNPNMSVTIGNSFQGKRAMFAAVMDDRVAIAAPHESGGDGGMAPFRGSHAGRIHHYWHDGVNRPHSWHETPRAGNAGRRAGGPIVNLLWSNLPHEESTWLAPFDMHMVAALQAGPVQGIEGQDVPGRAFLSLETSNFGTWTGWSLGRTVAQAAGEVFTFLGYEDYMIYFMKNSSHSIHDSDFPVIFAILDYQFGSNGHREANQVYVPNILSAALPGLWDGGLSALGRSPIEVDSFFMPWSRPGVHLLYTENKLVSEGLPATITAHTDAPYVELIIWSHGDGNRLWGVENPPFELDRFKVAAIDGIATFNLSADEVQIGRYELRTSGGDLEDRSVYFQGIDVRTAVRNAPTSDNIGSANAMFGFTSRILPNVEVYTTNATGETTRLQGDTTPNMTNTWIMPYGVRVPAIPGVGPDRFYTLRNLQFEAVPGFTFQMMFQENLNLGGWPNPDVPIIWNASPAVQHIGPYPHFRPGGNAPASWGLPNATHMGYSENRSTQFEATILNHEGVGTFDEERGVWTELTSWIIEFSEPMNPRDFGIGFDFSTDFELIWSNENATLTINFNDFLPNLNPADNYLNMHIIRLRDARAATGNSAAQMVRVHNDLISYALPGCDQEEDDTTLVQGIEIDQNDISLEIEDTYQLTFSLDPEDATNQNVEWTTSNANIVKVDENGLITAIAPGIATIRVTTECGDFYDEIQITVNTPDEPRPTLPAIPPIPGIPGIPNIPIPPVPGIPTIPGIIPPIPGIPGVPSIPIPIIPPIPGIPGIPGISRFRG